MTTVRTTGAALAVALGVLLSGCGSDGKSGDDVASLVSIIAPQPSSAAPVAGQRPLIRTGTSPEDAQRLQEAWLDCYEEHGIDAEAQQRKAAADATHEANLDPALKAAWEKAEQACTSKERQLPAHE